MASDSANHCFKAPRHNQVGVAVVSAAKPTGISEQRKRGIEMSIETCLPDFDVIGARDSRQMARCRSAARSPWPEAQGGGLSHDSLEAGVMRAPGLV